MPTQIDLDVNHCMWCGERAELLCDGRVVPAIGDSTLHNNTCNAKVCRACATEKGKIKAIVCVRGQGRGHGCHPISDTTDLCPFCVERGPEPLDRLEHVAALGVHVFAWQAARGPQPGEAIYIIDATNAGHRLYHGVPIDKNRALNSNAPLNAVVGWVRMLRELWADGARYIVPVFDGEGSRWRAELWPAYKSDRKPVDDDLKTQLPLLRALTRQLRLPVVCVDNTEADDMVASYVEAAVLRGLDVVIVSNDKDLMQLVRDGDRDRGRVRQKVMGKHARVLGPAEVRDEFGVGPDRLGDLLALAGDSSDCIPGVRGIGLKKAAGLLADHGDLEQLLDSWSFISPTKLGDIVHRYDSQIRMWRRVVDLQRDLELPLPLFRLHPWKPSKVALNDFFSRFGFPRWESAVYRYEG